MSKEQQQQKDLAVLREQLALGADKRLIGQIEEKARGAALGGRWPRGCPVRTIVAGTVGTMQPRRRQ